MAFTFDEAAHAYKLDDTFLPSITRILRPLNNFGMIPKHVLASKCVFGSSIHKMNALWLAQGVDEDSLDDTQKAYLKRFIGWASTHTHNIADVVTETPMFSKKYMFAGTPDIFFLSGALVEEKTRAFQRRKDTMQLAAQKLLIKDFLGITVKEAMVLSLLPDKIVPQVVPMGAEMRRAESDFLYLLDHHQRCKKHETITQAWKVEK